VSRIRIEPLDPATATDADLAAVHALDEAVDQVALPGDPPVPLGHALVCYRQAWPATVRRWWVARSGDEVVGRSASAYDDVPENRSHAAIEVAVHPAARRGGLGTDLLRPAVEAAREWDCSLLDIAARVGGPAEPFLRSLGAELRMVERRSRCLTAGLDRPVLEGWVGRAKERAAGYSLVVWDGPCPDALIEDFVALKHVMNTAPHEALDFDDHRFTAERWRQVEGFLLARDSQWSTICVRHDDSGELAGFTEMIFPTGWPSQAWQEDTGVWPKHRNRGLGRWLKAAMALRVLEERPAVERIETWNAGSNEAMLSINVAMGFAPVEYWGAWQVPTDVVRAELARRAATTPTDAA
jgi:mycothiol synthase